MTQIQTLIAKFKSTAEFSRVTGIPYRTAQEWKLGNRVPPDHRVDHIAAFVKNHKENAK